MSGDVRVFLCVPVEQTDDDVEEMIEQRGIAAYDNLDGSINIAIRSSLLRQPLPNLLAAIKPKVN